MADDNVIELIKIIKSLEVRVGRLEKILFSAYSQDDLFDEAIKIIKTYQKVSASLLQRRLKIGYARAARLLDELEESGYVGPGEGAKPRVVLNPKSQIVLKANCSEKSGYDCKF